MISGRLTSQTLNRREHSMTTVLVCLIGVWMLTTMTEYIRRGNPTSEQYWDTAVHPERKGY